MVPSVGSGGSRERERDVTSQTVSRPRPETVVFSVHNANGISKAGTGTVGAEAEEFPALDEMKIITTTVDGGLNVDKIRDVRRQLKGDLPDGLFAWTFIRDDDGAR